MLPTDAKSRKEVPIASGVLDYFPLALAAVARISFEGNKQHNGEGTPLRWDRSKSTDEADALIRHFLERGKLDADGQRHSAKMAWRSLALLQKEIEADQLAQQEIGIKQAEEAWAALPVVFPQPTRKDPRCGDRTCPVCYDQAQSSVVRR
jgi:hypothetical protein